MSTFGLGHQIFKFRVKFSIFFGVFLIILSEFDKFQGHLCQNSANSRQVVLNFKYETYSKLNQLTITCTRYFEPTDHVANCICDYKLVKESRVSRLAVAAGNKDLRKGPKIIFIRVVQCCLEPATFEVNDVVTVDSIESVSTSEGSTFGQYVDGSEKTLGTLLVAKLLSLLEATPQTRLRNPHLPHN